MSLPARQQRILDQIELILQAGDPRMKSMFAAFTRFASGEAMPAREAVRARLPRLRVLIPVMLVTVLSIVFLSIFATSTACPRLSSDQAVASAATRLAACTNSTDAWSKGGR
jgi:NhaP-type Na+/H+ or K+/H+ antiporter